MDSGWKLRYTFTEITASAQIERFRRRPQRVVQAEGEADASHVLSAGLLPAIDQNA